MNPETALSTMVIMSIIQFVLFIAAGLAWKDDSPRLAALMWHIAILIGPFNALLGAFA